MTSVASEALIYGALAFVLGLSAREFGTFNLAAGMWLVLGGWIGNFVAGFHGTPGSFFWAVLVMVCAGALQVSSPLILREALHTDPLRYLFVALGIHLGMQGIAATKMADTFATTLPLQPGSTLQLAFALGSVVFSLVVALFVYRSRWWSRAVIVFRAAGNGDRSPPAPARAISRLIGIEIGLLLLIGAVSTGIHKGLLSGTETFAIVPIVAVLLCGERWKWAPFLAGGVALLKGALEYQGSDWASYAESIKWLVVWIATLVFSVYWRAPLRSARVLHSLPPKSRSLRREPMLIGVIFGALIVALLLFKKGGTPDVAQRAALMATLALVAWFAIRFLGVPSVCWPMIGVTSAYVWNYGASVDSTSMTSLGLIMLSLAMWICYLLALRVVDEDRALVLDLATAAGLFEFLNESTWISGEHHIVEISPVLWGRIPDSFVLISQGAVWCVLLLVGVYITYHGPTRSKSLALLNPRLGWTHGVSFPWSFTEVALFTAMVCVTATLLHYSSPALTIAPAHAAVSTGLIILLFGALMARARNGVVIGLLLVVILRIFLEPALVKYGLVLDAIVGFSFAIAVLIVAFLKEGRLGGRDST